MDKNVSNAGPGSKAVVYATLFAGIGGFGITISMANVLGDGYASFAAFWSVYFVVLGALGGLQQEAARGTHPDQTQLASGNLRHLPLTGVLIVLVGATTGLIVLFAGGVLFPASTFHQGLAFAIGTSLSIPALIVSGALYGLRRWKLLASLIVLDVAVRWALLLIVASNTRDLAALSWAIAVPSFLTFIAILPFVHKAIGHRISLDSPPRKIAKNMYYATLASVGSAVLINGTPALLVGNADPRDVAFTAGLVFALTLTRAPLVVGSVALQSFFVVWFRDSPSTQGRKAIGTALIGSGIGAAISISAWIVGKPILEGISGLKMSFSPEYLALLTLSSIPTLWIVISGALCLAVSKHRSYTVGWLVAALVTIGTLLLPNSTDWTLIVALTVGPLSGLLIHVVPLARGSQKDLN